MSDLHARPVNPSTKTDPVSRTTHSSKQDAAANNEELSTIAKQIRTATNTRGTMTPGNPQASVQRSAPLMPNAILRLQNTIGNQETMRVLRRMAEAENIPEVEASPTRERRERPIPIAHYSDLIQRYVQVKGGKYTTYKGSKEDMFKLQAAHPSYDWKGSDTLDPNNPLSESVTGVVKQVELPQYKLTTPNSPDLIVSDDGTLAVPSKEGLQSKVLYAVEEVIADANNRLIAAGSMVRLVKVGNSIGLTHNHQFRLLHQVKPYAAAAGPTARGAYADFGTSICIDMATQILSGIHPAQANNRRMIFEQPGGQQERVGFGLTSGQNLQNVHKLAEAVTDNQFDPNNNIGTQVTGAARQNTTGQTYGTRLGQGQLDQNAQQLGINQYAKPEVGEAFSIHSIQTAIDNTVHTDFATGHDNMDTWGYHFAGVVATSLDGQDYVTLENYNRSKEILTDALTSIVRKRAKKLGATVTQNLLDAITNDPGSGTTAIMEILEQAFGFKSFDDQAAGELQQYINSLTPSGKLWFFAMYGSNAGQTFHEIQAASGGYNNPMTVRTGHQNAPVVPAAAAQGALQQLTVTSNAIQQAGGVGEGGWGTTKVSSHWKLIYAGVQTLENKGYSRSRITDLHSNILGWQEKNRERQEVGDDQKRVLLDQLRPEVENMLAQYKNGTLQ